jgi:Tol biopolymer transport system component
MRMPCRARKVLAFGLTIAVGAAAPAWAQRATERVSVSSGGDQSDGDSFSSGISADGRYVAFDSRARNLEPGDTNFPLIDVFVRDRRTGITERVSVGPNAVESNGASRRVGSPSADGRFVAFTSDATNLVPNDTNFASDVFVRDRKAGKTERVSVKSGGGQATGGGEDALGSFGSSLTPDGRYVAFRSFSEDLVPDDTNGRTDGFVHDRRTGKTERVSVSSRGDQGDEDSFGGQLTPDGRFVAFISDATNLVPGDRNAATDVFVRDRRRGATERVSVSSKGDEGEDSSSGSSISADGRYVAFASSASNLVPGDTNGFSDVFVRDRLRGTTERVSMGVGGVESDSDSGLTAISADGRYVAFDSFATNLVPRDTNDARDLFVHDRRSGRTERVSVAFNGRQGDRDSSRGGSSALSADGRIVAFESDATNLVPNDTNELRDIFVRRLTP